MTGRVTHGTGPNQPLAMSREKRSWPFNLRTWMAARAGSRRWRLSPSPSTPASSSAPSTTHLGLRPSSALGYTGDTKRGLAPAGLRVCWAWLLHQLWHLILLVGLGHKALVAVDAVCPAEHTCGCRLIHTSSLLHCRCTVASPCTNRPIKCTICNKVPTLSLPPPSLPLSPFIYIVTTCWLGKVQSTLNARVSKVQL